MNQKIMAVVGATKNKKKYGFKVFKSLLEEKDKKVYPVNPKHKEILGVKCFPSLKNLPEKPELVITVVPPKVTENIVKECIKLGIKNIWMQPGSESKKAIELCKKNGINAVFNACLIVDELKKELE